MQTLKTAAIVVLMMTVMYGAYVSLTTPPEPLPPDVKDMLVITRQGTLEMESGLPDSLGALEIHSGTASESLAPQMARDQSMDSSDSSIDTLGVASVEPTMPSEDSGYVATLTDASAEVTPTNPANLSSAGQSTVAAANGQRSDSTSGQPSYPNTNHTFELPDPTNIASSLTTMGNGKLVMTGASPNSSATIPPPSQAVAQVAAVDTPGGLMPPSSADSKHGIRSSNLGLANAISTADRQFADDQRKEALATLSIFYNTPNLSGEERSELVSRLDPLAAEVIYSRRHLLERPHRVGQNETLIEIATRYEVPWQLLANINQIHDPVTVLPGTELKVVRGPFRAEVNLRQKELTVFLGDLYAGRFPIGIGNDPPPKPGTFTVQDKQNSRIYYDAAGSPVPPGSPDNPYGNTWLDLGGQMCIHGSPSTTSPTDKGCISLAADFADDLYGILSQGSSVTIRR